MQRFPGIFSFHQQTECASLEGDKNATEVSLRISAILPDFPTMLQQLQGHL